MAITKLAPSTASTFTATLSPLSNNGIASLASPFCPNTNGDFYADIELVIPSFGGTTRLGPFIEVAIRNASDGTSNEFVSSAGQGAVHYNLGNVYISNGAGAKRAIIQGVPFPPIRSGLSVINRTAVSITLTINIRFYTEQVVQ